VTRADSLPAARVRRRPGIRSAATGVLVAVALVACDAGAPPPTPSTTTTAPARHGRALGLDEPRVPQPFTLDQRLLEAVRQNDRATIDLALERGAHLGAKDDLQRSTVLLAVLDAGDLDLVRWLHEQGVPVDEADSGGRTALSFAAANGRLDLVRYLVESGAVVDRRDVQQRTPLFHAALGDHADVIAYLLDQTADANARDQFGDTPLIAACAKGNAAAAELLVQRGADPALEDQEGRTAKERSAPGVPACQKPGPP
jgi:hypothetical protein